MSLYDLERAIKQGVSQGIGRAVGNAIGLSNLERSIENYATEMSKNIKICPSCQKPTSSDKKFCPECGTSLPEQTVAQGSVCTQCGKQNSIGTKFCQDCGTKLPATIAEEQASSERDANVFFEWEEKLAQYPKWNCGGCNFEISDYDTYHVFSADFKGRFDEAKNAVEQYRQLLLQNGFQMAGQNPTMWQLYKKVNGICYHVDIEHSFDGDPDCPTIGFDISEPYGGFDYVKPEPKPSFGGLKDLFGL